MPKLTLTGPEDAQTVLRKLALATYLLEEACEEGPKTWNRGGSGFSALAVVKRLSRAAGGPETSYSEADERAYLGEETNDGADETGEA